MDEQEVVLSQSQWDMMIRQSQNLVAQLNQINRAGTLATSNQIPNYQASGGLFADTNLERPVTNITIQPRRALANEVPLVMSNTTQIQYGYVTQVSSNSFTPQDTVCEIPPQVANDISTCVATYSRGRLELASRTLEPDAIIEKLNKGVQDDLYFVGDIRGVGAKLTDVGLNGPVTARDLPLIHAGTIRRQFMWIGRSLDLLALNWFWYGDPTSVSQNGSGGGWKSFWGLNSLIANDYGSKAFVSGTNCAALNSEVIDFSTYGNGLVGIDPLYNVMQFLEAKNFNKAFYYGTPIEDFVIAMHPILWDEWQKYLPIEMLSDSIRIGGTDISATINLNDGAASMWAINKREEMANTQTIRLNNRTYRIKLDGTLNLTSSTVNGKQRYKGTIYGIPLRVAGEQTLYWSATDYRMFDRMLPEIGYDTHYASGWTDGGIFNWVVDRSTGRCFLVRGVVKPGLVFRAPHLAWRLDNVSVETDGALIVPSTAP